MDNDWHLRKYELFTARKDRWRLHSMKKLDTRRFNDAGKLIGEHASRRYGSVAWIRKCWARAERRYAKEMLRGESHLRGLAHWRTEYNYKGT